MSLRLSDHPISNGDDMSRTWTPSNKYATRSLVRMASHLKPARQKIQDYFTKSRHSAPESVFRAWRANGLVSMMKMESPRKGSLKNPEVAISPIVQDSRLKPALVRGDSKQSLEHKPDLIPQVDSRDMEESVLAPTSATPPPPALEDSPSSSSPSVSPTVPSVVATLLPSTRQRPPSPPPSPAAPEIGTLPVIPPIMSMETDPTEPRVRRGPSLIRPRPRSVSRRRAKTPVYKSAQWEIVVAKRRIDAPVSRQGSVRTIARQYRNLIEDTLIENHLRDETDISHVPRIPSIHGETAAATAAEAPQVQESNDNQGDIESHSADKPRESGHFESSQPECKDTSSPVASDADTLVSFHDDAAYLKPLLFPTASSAEKGGKAQDCVRSAALPQSPATDDRRFRIGLELLTRELLTAFADRSARTTSDSNGLQIEVMIAAYERLRDRVLAMESRDPQLKGTKAMFNLWLEALRTIQKSIADEGAGSGSGSGSEYGDE